MLLREYLRLLWKYRLVISASTVLSSILFLIYAFTVTPQFRASARLRISTYEPILTSTKIEDMLAEKSRESNYVETQLHELRSLALADRVLDDPEVRRRFLEASGGATLEDFVMPGDETPTGVHGERSYRNPVALLQQYIDGVSVEAVRRTAHVLVSYRSPSAEVAALLANRHAQAYIDYVRSGRIDQQASGLAFLRARADELRTRVVALEREIADYAEANAIVAVNKDENITVQKMSQLNKLLTDAIASRIAAENIYKEAESNLGATSAGFDDSSVQALRSELVRRESEYAQMGEKFLPGYPKMKQLKSQIDDLREALIAQRRQIIAGLKARAQAAAQEEERLRDELNRQKSQTFELSKKQVQYNMLNRELISSRELLENVLKQIQETSLAVESNASNVSIVDSASVPQSAFYPRKHILLLAGVLLGLGVGVGLAFFLRHLDNTVKTPEDLTRSAGVPSLGLIPSFDGERDAAAPAGPKDQQRPDEGASSAMVVNAPLTDLPVVYLSSPQSLVAEAYRTIRTGLLLSQAGEAPRTLLVTSAQSSEGKTTSAVNLAASLASSGSRVVLIDADLRRPSLHRYFNVEFGGHGLVEVLAGQLPLEEVWREGLIPGVTAVFSGRIPPNPAELLGSLQMAQLIDRLSETFDYVVIDSPPVLPVTDSVILSRYVDGVVLVVRGAATPKKVLQDAVSRLRAVGARVLGGILNDVNVASGDYAYYNRYYYAYYRPDEGGASKKRSRAVGG